MYKAFLLHKMCRTHTRNYLKYISKSISPLLVLFLQFSGIDHLFELFSFGVDLKEKDYCDIFTIEEEIGRKGRFIYSLAHAWGIQSHSEHLTEVFFRSFLPVLKCWIKHRLVLTDADQNTLSIYFCGTQSQALSLTAPVYSTATLRHDKQHSGSRWDPHRPSMKQRLSCSSFSNQDSFQNS